MKNENVLHYFHEYLMYSAIEELNRSQNLELRVSQGKDLRKKFLKEMNVSELKKGDTKPLLSAINKVCKDEYDYEVFDEASVSDNFYKFILTEFKGLTGVNTNGFTYDEPYLPISPYDPNFSKSKTVMKNGPALLYVSDKQLSELFNGSPDELLKSKDLKLLNKTVLKYKADDKFKTDGRLLTLDDLSGMSRLMPYMSNKEYEKVAPWVIAVGKDNVNNYMSNDAIDRSIAILEYLNNEGISYEIVTDSFPGQIKAKLKGTKMDVRLTDSHENEHFVGKVYDDGSQIYYNTNYKMKGSNYSAPYKDMSNEDVINLIKFARGEKLITNSIDGTDLTVGSVFQYNVQRYDSKTKKAKLVPLNGSYISNNEFTASIKPYMINGKPEKYGSKVNIHVAGGRSNSTAFANENVAAEFLNDAVLSARKNFEERLNVEGLLNDYSNYLTDNTFEPVFDSDKIIGSAQKEYWSLLKGQDVSLLKPGKEYDKYIDSLENNEYTSNEDANAARFNLLYDGTNEEKIRQHSIDLINHHIGSYNHDEDGLRFDPVGVIAFMDSPNPIGRRTDDIVNALRQVNITASELKGSNFYNESINDKLLKFDVTTSQIMHEHENPFIKRMYEVVKDSIESNGCVVKPSDIKIDDNGVVSYVARQAKLQGASSGDFMRTVSGEIGQIFIPDENGVIKTKFAGRKNYITVPGYEANIIPQKPGENKTVEERTRLKGYEQLLVENIRYTLRNNLLSGRDKVGDVVGLNGVYRRLYDTRHPIDFYERTAEDGLSADWRDAIIRTESRRVKYPNEIKEESTINADYLAKAYGLSMDLRNDNNIDGYKLTGGRNMALLEKDGDGYFDPIMTGGSENQGTVKFLVEGAVVNADGSITRSSLDDRTPLMKHPDMKYSKYDPFDRQQMTCSNLLQASSITRPVNVACMTFGGWNFDDPVIISKKFADEYKIRNTNGELRSLIVGDKISDLHGNKGVISLIVDTHMDWAEAKSQGIEKEFEWFNANPGLDVVMAPFSSVSRFNGGSTRELMSNTMDLYHPDTDEVIKGASGQARFIITHMSVDAKTKNYTDDDVKAGKGRKASSQLAWALNAQDCPAILSEFYSSNNSSITNFREYLVTMGLDMDEKGNFRENYKEHTDEDRFVFEIPELKYKLTSKGTKILDIKEMRSEFGKMISNKGGVLELPFELNYPVDKPLEVLNEDGNKTWGLPVLSKFLRSGQEFEDGSSSMHDYTYNYLFIYEKAVSYLDAKSRLSGDLSADDRLKYEKILETAPVAAQAEFDKLTFDISRRHFEGKHNIVRDGIMSNRLNNSATAVWTADPNLNINEIKISSSIAKDKHLRDNDIVLVWRDPMLRKEGLKAKKAVISDDIIGVAINPVMDKCFDGDFDGDSVGLFKPSTKEAIMEAKTKLSVGANLLDYGVADPETGYHPLAINKGLDITVGMFNNKEYKDQYDTFVKDINEFEKAYKDGLISDEDVSIKRDNAVKGLSKFYKNVLNDQFGTALIKYDSMENHLESLVHSCVETGAKGNIKKVRSYMKYLGVSDGKSEGDIDYSNLKDHRDTLASRQDHIDTQYATGVKSFGTGIAGMFSQRGMATLRNLAPDEILEMTYVATQSILQAKHDPIEARHKYELLMSSARKFWKGYEMEKISGDNGIVWQEVRDKTGKPVQATKSKWIDSIIDFYRHPDGMNVDINNNCIKIIADKLTGVNGEMLNLEENAKESYAAPMDKLAYGGNFDTIVDFAKNNVNLFEGKFNSMFAPSIITKNWNIDDDTKLRGLTKLDVRLDKTKEPKVEILNTFGLSNNKVSSNNFERKTIVNTFDVIDLKEDVSSDVEMEM